MSFVEFTNDFVTKEDMHYNFGKWQGIFEKGYLDYLGVVRGASKGGYKGPWYCHIFSVPFVCPCPY